MGSGIEEISRSKGASSVAVPLLFSWGTRREQLILFLGLVKPHLFAVRAEFAGVPDLEKPIEYRV